MDKIGVWLVGWKDMAAIAAAGGEGETVLRLKATGHKAGRR
ncbi:MAG: hypothetical protein ABSD75_13615 [Terriglobales bacterium]|jgi:hypothetical protein